MKWFNLLTSKTGKLVLKAPQLLAIAGVGVLASYSVLQADKKVAEQERVRSISSLENSPAYEGLQLDDGGRLTSIRIRDGLNQIATPQERARMEKGEYGNGNFGLDAADNVGGKVGSSLGGRAAETSDTDGLGMGRNATVIEEGTPAGGNAQAPSVNGGNLGGRSSRQNTREGANNTLAPTTMSHASGTGVSNASPVNGGNSNTVGAPNAGLSGHGTREGYKLSGKMDGGTNPFSLREKNGSHTTSNFLASSRKSDPRGGRNSGRNKGNDLQDIAKRSADAASNQFRSNTEGGHAFLASRTDSGGMSIDGKAQTDESSGSSADFKAPLNKNLKAIRNTWGDTEDKKNKKRDEERDTLFKWMIAAIAAAVIAIPIIRYLTTLGDVPYAKLCKVLALVVAAGALVVCGIAISKAIKYWSNYGFGWMSGGALGIASASAVAIITAAIMGAKGKLKPGNFKQTIKGYAMTFGTKFAGDALNQLKEQDTSGSKKKK